MATRKVIPANMRPPTRKEYRAYKLRKAREQREADKRRHFELVPVKGLKEYEGLYAARVATQDKQIATFEKAMLIPIKYNPAGRSCLPDGLARIHAFGTAMIIGFKKVYAFKLLTTNPHASPKEAVHLGEPVMCVLRTEGHLRYQPDNHKCRCDQARVLAMWEINSKKPVAEACSSFDKTFVYRQGAIVEPTKKFSHKYIECASGVHFFLTMKEAAEY